MWLCVQYEQPSQAAPPGGLAPLLTNVDVVVSMAERLYYNCRFAQAHAITARWVCTKEERGKRCGGAENSLLPFVHRAWDSSVNLLNSVNGMVDICLLCKISSRA